VSSPELFKLKRYDFGGQKTIMLVSHQGERMVKFLAGKTLAGELTQEEALDILERWMLQEEAVGQTHAVLVEGIGEES